MRSITLTALCVQIAPGIEPALLSEGFQIPPIVFVHMEKDKMLAKQIAIIIELLQQKNVKAIEYIVKPHSLTPTFLAEKIQGFSFAFAQKIYDIARTENLLTEDGLLKQDPRGGDLMLYIFQSDNAPLKKAVQEYKAAIEEELNVLFAAHELTSEYIDLVMKFFDEALSKN